jgi:tight adherence protein B
MTAWWALAACWAAVAVAFVAPVDAAGRLEALRGGRARPAGRLTAADRSASVRPGRWPLARAGPLVGARAGARAAEQVVGLLTAFAAELRAGAAPVVALDRAVRDVTAPGLAADLEPVVESMRLGADGPSALRAAAAAHHPELGWLAAGWELADAHGVPLAPAATQIAVAARDQLRHVAAIRAELAGPRTSARMLALLPVVGLALGSALGADPLHVLVATPAGLVCLVGAVLLEYAGLRWTTAQVRRAERAG